MKILCVEDGSIDIDAIESDGLRNGKILVYRQGATPPFMLDIGDADKDEELAIYKRALELACNDIQDMYCSDYCTCTRDESCKGKCCYQIYYDKEQFLNQAKKELEEQK